MTDHKQRIRAVVERQMESSLRSLPEWIDSVIKSQASNLAAQILGARWDSFDRKLKFDNGSTGKIGAEIQEQARARARELLADALPEITLTDKEKQAIAKAYRHAYTEALKHAAAEHGMNEAHREVAQVINDAIDSVLAEPGPAPDPLIDDLVAAIDFKDPT